MKRTRTTIRTATPLLLAAIVLAAPLASAQQLQAPLLGKSIPKFVDPLPTFVGNRVDGTQPLTVTMKEFQQMVLPAALYAGLPEPFSAGTYVWGYEISDGTTTYPAHYPGFTVEAQRGVPTTMTYVNDLIDPVLQDYLLVDQTLHWADPLMQMGMMTPYTGPVAAVVHLHGGEVPSAIDGGPDAWFTPNSGGFPAYTGSAYNATVEGVPVGNTYTYPNTQEAATLWFHDHTLGATRLNVYAGLAAFYLLRGDGDTGPGNELGLPADPYEIEMAIQDRSFDTNGQLLFPRNGINAMEHPFWVPEFFGDAVVVNGKTWPYLNVEPRRYRFRLLNGSNARFYSLSCGKGGPAIWQIGTDGGLLDVPVKIAFPGRLVLGPGERADIILDFTAHAGKTFVMDNNAKAPYPAGTNADPQTTGQIMQIRVGPTALTPDVSFDPAAVGARLRPGSGLVKLVDFANGTPAVTPDVARVLTLNEIMGMGGPLEVLVNNSKWMGEMSPNAGGVTELPQQGATELWRIVNMTADAHPMHLHLVQFQLVSRQSLQTKKYTVAYDQTFTGGVSPVDGMDYPSGVFIPGYGPPLPYLSTEEEGYLGGNPDPTPFLQGAPTPANPNERGWKDTIKMFPGEVTTVLVRFAPTDVPAGATLAGTNYFSFDPTEGPGYVWHCHIVDHEDNEMMRQFKVGSESQIDLSKTDDQGRPETMPAAGVVSLDQNTPNPFNPTTEIRFVLAEAGRVSLRLYNVRGQEVQSLIDADAPAGVNTVMLDATNLPSGVYFYRLQAGNETITRKMSLVR